MKQQDGECRNDYLDGGQDDLQILAQQAAVRCLIVQLLLEQCVAALEEHVEHLERDDKRAFLPSGATSAGHPGVWK